MMQQQQSGGMMGGLGGMVAQGMAIGTGSAIAHTAVDGVMSSMGMGRHSNSAPAAAPVQQEAPDACSNQNKAFQDCLTGSGGDIARCQFYFDTLNQCRGVQA